MRIFILSIALCFGFLANAQRIDLLQNLNSNGDATPKYFGDFNGELIFQANDGTGTELWKLDAASPTLTPLTNFSSENALAETPWVKFQNAIYFVADDGVFGTELWKYDGTSTTRVSDLNPNGDASISQFYLAHDALYFTAIDGVFGRELWKYNGTDFTRITDLNPAGHSNFKEMIAYGDELIFSADNGTPGVSLWKYDGISVSEVAKFTNSNNQVHPQQFIEFQGKIYFQSADSLWNHHLFQYDGLTAKVADGFPHRPFYSLNRNFITYQNELYLIARDTSNTYGFEMWKYNGTTAEMLPELIPDAGDGFHVFQTSFSPTIHNGLLYFSGNLNGANRKYLHTWDGSEMNLITTDFYHARKFITLGDDLFFMANSDDDGREFWMIRDGQFSQIEDTNPMGAGVSNSTFTDPILFNGKIYFSGNDGENGQEVFQLSPCGKEATFQKIACQTFTTPSGNNTWTTSGTFVDSYADADGCKFDYTYELQIGEPTSSNILIVECEKYQAPDGKYYFESGTYTAVIENELKCDSTITIDLEILEIDGGEEIVTACDTYTWINGETYFSSTNTAKHTLSNVNGCDSIVTLNLTLKPIDDEIGMSGNDLRVSESDATYQWKNCDTGELIANATTQVFSPTEAGNFAVEISKNGCTKTSPCFTYQILNDPMSGCYTLGPDSADYENFTTAIADLELRGVNDAVCFNVQPGIYNENLVIKSVTGSSRYNTISFIGDNASPVVLESTEVVDSSMVILEGVQGIVFRNITFSGDEGSELDKYAIEMNAYSKHITIDGCHFQDEQELWFSFIVGNSSRHLTLTNSTFGEGLGGFDVYNCRDVEIRNNDFGPVNWVSYSFQDTSVTFVENELPNSLGSVFFYTNIDLLISKNYIHSSEQSGLALEHCRGVEVSNNFIISRATSSTNSGWILAAGTFIRFSEDVKFYHNTVVAESRALHLADVKYSDFRNNIFRTKKNQPIVYAEIPWYLPDVNTRTLLDNNIYHRDSSYDKTLFYIYQHSFDSLTNWQTAYPEFNLHSKYMSPEFVSEDDLHLVTENGYNFGNPAIGLTEDIDGHFRNLTDFVNVGADEMCYATAATDFVTTCDTEYLWMDGNTYTENNNTSTFILKNNLGCDSLVTLDLTFAQPSESVDVITACDEYTWIDGNTYTSNNNSATHALTTVYGCDSIVQLDLTIVSVNSNVSVNESSLTATATEAIYQWVDCNTEQPIIGENGKTFTATETGSYALIVTQGGCTETSACFDIIISNTVDLLSANKIQIFPNPTNGDFKIDLGELQNDFSVQIFNALGQKVKHLQFAQREEIQLTLKGASGMYIVEVISINGERAVFQVLKS